MLALHETIRPSVDLRNHYSEISAACKNNREAVMITVNGRGDTVSLSYEIFQTMKARLALLELLAESENDVQNHRTAPLQDTFDTLRATLMADANASQNGIDDPEVSSQRQDYMKILRGL